MKKSCTLGLDLGGTKIAGVLADSAGKPFKKKKIATFGDLKTSKHVVGRLAALAEELLAEKPRGTRLSGIGLASAGPMDVLKGELVFPVNFEGWRRVRLIKDLSKELRSRKISFSKIFFQNDAMAAALAEGWVGKARKTQSYAAITVGTGIGTGVVINGAPCQTFGRGSEWGHIIVDDGTTVENMASATAILKNAKKMGFKGASTFELVEWLKKRPNSKFRLAFERAAFALAILCYNLSIGTGVQKIVFSGGLTQEKQLFLSQTQHLYKTLIREKMKLFEAAITHSSLGEWAAAIGAASMPYHPGCPVFTD